MSGTDDQRPIKVVLVPDVIGTSFWDPPSLQLLQLWRDGKIQPILDRELLLRYLKLLRSLGLSKDLVRRWCWWFTRPEKSLFLGDRHSGDRRTVDLCTDIARSSSADYIIHSAIPSKKSQDEEPPWVLVEDFLQEVTLGK